MQMCEPHAYFLVAAEKATMVTSGGKALSLFWFYGFVCGLEKPAQWLGWWSLLARGSVLLMFLSNKA